MTIMVHNSINKLSVSQISVVIEDFIVVAISQGQLAYNGGANSHVDKIRWVGGPKNIHCKKCPRCC